MTRKHLIALFSLVWVICAGAQAPRWEYNPAEPPAHDPVAIECEGTWYLFSTGFGVNVFSSSDQVNWEYQGPAFEEAPAWAVGSVPNYKGHTWAPDIFYHDGLYYLYYSCSSFGKNDSAIGVAVNKTLNPASPDYGWEDQGCVVRSVAGRDNWNAIDPHVFLDDDGSAWMSFGSFWSGIRLVRLDASLTRLAEPEEWYPICRRPEGTAKDTSKSDKAIKADDRGKDFDPGNGAVEAPFIVKRDGYYYLFVSYDLCCRGPKSTYKVVVGRSRKVTGPYLDRDGVPLMKGGGTEVVSGNKRYPGVGHCAVVPTPEGDKLYFHAYDKEYKYNAHLMIRPLHWDNGWPHVRL